MSDGAWYSRTALNFTATAVYVGFLVRACRVLRRGKQRLDRFMVTTVLMIGASVLLTNYGDLAMIFSLPRTVGPFFISQYHDLYFPLFIGILVDIARLSLITLSLRDPQTLAKKKILVLTALFSIIAGFLSIELVYDYSEDQWGTPESSQDFETFVLILYQVMWYGMHGLVIVGYLTLYLLISRYYRAFIASHRDFITQAERDQMASDLFTLKILFGSFSLSAVFYISMDFWLNRNDPVRYTTAFILDAVARLLQISGVSYSFSKRIAMDTRPERQDESLFIRDSSEHASYRDEETGIYSAQFAFRKAEAVSVND